MTHPDNEIERSEGAPAGDASAEPLLPAVETPPSLEELLTTIRKMGVKIDELTEAKRMLKKQAEAMMKKL